MDTVARHYDQLGMRLRAVAEAMNLEDPAVKTAEVEQMLSRWPADGRAPPSLLEIGCGYGRLVPGFLERGVRYTGLDVNGAYVAWCRREHGAAARFLVADFLRDAGPPGERFDIVAFPWLLLTHYPFAAQAEMLGKAADLLAKDAPAYIVFDHLPAAAVGAGVGRIEAHRDGQVLVPDGAQTGSDLRCYVLHLGFARRVAERSGLTLHAAWMRLEKLAKQYVFLAAADR